MIKQKSNKTLIIFALLFLALRIYPACPCREKKYTIEGARNILNDGKVEEKQVEEEEIPADLFTSAQSKDNKKDRALHFHFDPPPCSQRERIFCFIKVSVA